jgi:hypothetical protein
LLRADALYSPAYVLRKPPSNRVMKQLLGLTKSDIEEIKRERLEEIAKMEAKHAYKYSDDWIDEFMSTIDTTETENQKFKAEIDEGFRSVRAKYYEDEEEDDPMDPEWLAYLNSNKDPPPPGGNHPLE